MKPTIQTKTGQWAGNCLAACVASIFEIPIESIPDFGIGDDWYIHFTEWCVEVLNVYPLDFSVESDLRPRGFHIINGPSLHGEWWHSVVGLHGKTCFDPYPDRPALKNKQTYTIFVRIIE